MPNRSAMELLASARAIQREARTILKLPSEVARPTEQPVLPHSLFDGTRGYIEKVVFQINQSYTVTCFDCCAVMIRRLIEVLIIEAFEHHGKGNAIKDKNGDYFRLDDLVRLTLAEPAWSLGRNTKQGLHALKQIGDLSAHSRRYNAKREYIDDITGNLRTVAEE